MGLVNSFERQYERVRVFWKIVRGGCHEHHQLHSGIGDGSQDPLSLEIPEADKFGS